MCQLVEFNQFTSNGATRPIFDLDGQGWEHYRISELSYEQCKEVAEKCSSDSKWERAKSIAWASVGVIAALVLIGTAFTIAKIALVLLAIALLPIAPLFPVYALLCFSGALAAGGFFAHATLTAIYEKMVPLIMNHWKHANHLSEQSNQCVNQLIALKG